MADCEQLLASFCGLVSEGRPAGDKLLFSALT